MRIMALIELIFTLPKNNRNLSFEKVSEIIALPKD